MLSSLVVLSIIVLAVLAGGFLLLTLAAFVINLLLFVVLLPFRLVGWILWLLLVPLKALAGAAAAVFGSVAVGVGLLCAVLLTAVLAVPLLPVVAIAIVVWLLVRAARPARTAS